MSQNISNIQLEKNNMAYNYSSDLKNVNIFPPDLIFQRTKALQMLPKPSLCSSPIQFPSLLLSTEITTVWKLVVFFPSLFLYFTTDVHVHKQNIVFLKLYINIILYITFCIPFCCTHFSLSFNRWF